jgi:hypothetical protein
MVTLLEFLGSAVRGETRHSCTCGRVADRGGVGVISVIIGGTGVSGPRVGESSTTGRLKDEEDKDDGIGVRGREHAEEQRISKP